MDKGDDAERLVSLTESSNPIERIGARVSLSRMLPYGADDEKRLVRRSLGEDIRSHREDAFEYLAGLNTSEDRAYAVALIDESFGFGVDERHYPGPISEQKRARDNFLEYAQDLNSELREVEDEYVRAHVSRMIAMEGKLDPGLEAVKILGEIRGIEGSTKEKAVSSPFGRFDFDYVNDILENIANRARLVSVKYAALNQIAEISDNTQRGRHLQNLITSNDERIAVNAVNLYISKGRAGHESEKSLAVEAMMARKRGGMGKKEVVANPKPSIVEYAFDRVMDLTPHEERLKTSHNFVHRDEMERRRAGMGLPGLSSSQSRTIVKKSLAYLASHIDEIGELEMGKDRAGMLFNLAGIRSDDEISTRAIDLLADESKEGVEVIAQIYTDWHGLETHLNDEAKRRIRETAIRFVRKFADIEDKSRARAALLRIYGHMDGKTHVPGDGFMYKEEGSGKPINEVAGEELQRLPEEEREPTEKERLAEALGIS